MPAHMDVSVTIPVPAHRSPEGRDRAGLPSGGSLAATTLAIDRRAATGISLAPAGTGCAIAGSATT